jgi:glycosyltransferase involved in cell wall biosynthesis
VRVALIGPLPPELGGSGPGGVATHQAHLAAGLSTVPDVHVSLLATNTYAPAPVPYAAWGLHVPVGAQAWLAPAYLRRVGAPRLVRYALRLASSEPNGSRRERLANLLWYRYFLYTVQPDVVHVQHPLERLAHVNDVARLERRRWPLVVTAHSFFGEHAKSVIHGFMAPNLRAADRVIAVSPHIADQAAQLGVDRARIRVIRSGIDTERYSPRDQLLARSRLGLAAEAPLVLFVGNLEPRKQLSVLLRAFCRVRALVPGALLVVVGAGEELGPLETLAAQLGITSAVCFTSRVEHEVLLDWYAAADVFALPSSSEAQGIVALEAMACGLPVVASAVGGLLGTIDDGQDGYLVSPGEVEPLVQRLCQLLCDRALRESIGAAALGRVGRDFSWQRAVQATADVYRELLECPSR